MSDNTPERHVAIRVDRTVRRGCRVMYEVPEPEPLLELNDVEASIVGTLYRRGESVPDSLIPPDATWGETAMTLSQLEMTNPQLIVKSWMGYKLTAEGVRHAEELGL